MFSTTFSFGASSSPTYDSNASTSTRSTSRSVSPCSSSSPTTGQKPSEPTSITDITSQFASHRLRREALISYESCESYANLEPDDAWLPEGADDGWFCTRQRSRTSVVQRPHSPSRRLQRQTNTRLLCSGSHHAEIARLVESMVERGDQCEVQAPREIDAEDEGYDSDEAQGVGRRQTGLSSRPRSWEWADKGVLSHARVNKPVRSRKDKHGKRKSSQAAQ